MHELSIAVNIVDLVKDELEKTNSSVVNEIEIEIGKMSGVILDALQFAMEEAVKNSPLSQAKVIYHELTAEAKCSKCQNLFEVDDFFAVCPFCGSFETDVINGKELKIKKIKVG